MSSLVLELVVIMQAVKELQGIKITYLGLELMTLLSDRSPIFYR